MKKEKEDKINQRIYWKVSYADKDNAKFMGALWDGVRKLWYSPNYQFKLLIEKYD